MISGENQKATSILTDHVKKPYQSREFAEPWRNLPEVPTKEEIMPATDEDSGGDQEPEQWNDYQQDPVYDPNLPHNIVDGPWPSKERYISAHYRILREDAIAGLRHSVASVKRRPAMMDDKETCIYTHVTFKGLLLARIGPAFRVEFSHERSEKQIRWEQSKRLIPGTIVALTPHRDMFRKICKIAVVAARSIEGGLDQNPPQIDLFWGSPDDAVFDPVEPYVMVESRSGYFEASRHMLVAMQKLMTEKFHLANHLVSLDPNVKAPVFTEVHPWMNLNSLVRPELEAEELKDGTRRDETKLNNVDVLKEFPDVTHTGMDKSQKKAFEAMLTKRIAIIQGPPGTGKTFVSVSALKVMVDNWVPGDPPIIVAAQTNHALDQLLTHIMSFEPNIVRLGSRCDRENVEILKRTLHELRMSAEGAPKAGVSLGAARREYQARVNEIKKILFPILSDKLLTTDVLLEHGIITQAQLDSLFEEGWADENEKKEEDIGGWLTPDQLMLISGAPPVNQGLPMEESDIEYEQIQELELEMVGGSQESRDKGLSGEWLSFGRRWTGKHATSVNTHKIKRLLAKKNLYEIPKADRGEVYRFWEKQLNAKMLRYLRGHLRVYKETTDSYQITKWLSNIVLIRHLGIKVIGCTTTGLSKYRGLLAALEPRTMLIEEAAETLEGTIIASMIDSLEQLILVGDHHQLQAHCNVSALECAPYNMNISMFERLVNNHIGYVMLNRQRRMISDVRQLLCIEPNPFYRDLHDHPSVWDRQVNRPPIPGMGGKDTYFFHHNWPEARNADSSRYNKDEAEMIAGFYNHLILNGIEQSKITILTFYNGQRKTILRELKSRSSPGGSTYFQVHTVDSYQGEENDVILLSLVRSNYNMGIGFLDNKNRLVVALSRARRGLYIFGNSVTLTVGEEDGRFMGRDPLWDPLIQYMKCQLRFDLDGGLPIICSKHGRTITIREPGDWHGKAGGCNLKCTNLLPCGHPCPYACHSFAHSSVVCQEPCPKKVEGCGHGCSGSCGERCYCKACKLELKVSREQPGSGEMAYCSKGPIANAVLYGSPTQYSSMGLGNNSSRCLAFSGSPKKSQLTSSDIRNDTAYSGASTQRREFSGHSIQKDFTDSPKYLDGCSSRPPTKYSQASGPRNGSPPTEVNAWQTWDAKASDKKLAEKLAREDAARPKVDLSKLFYKETYRHVIFKEDGTRMNDPKRSVTRLVHRFKENSAEGGDLQKSASRALQKKRGDMNLSESHKGKGSVAHPSPSVEDFQLGGLKTQAVGVSQSMPPFAAQPLLPKGDYPADGEEGCPNNNPPTSPRKKFNMPETHQEEVIRATNSHTENQKIDDSEDLINFD